MGHHIVGYRITGNHVIRCHWTQATWIRHAVDDVASMIWQAVPVGRGAAAEQ
jgi:hypothetical protein